MKAGCKRTGNSRSRCGGIDKHPARTGLDHTKPLRPQPTGQRVEVMLRRAIAFPCLLRSQPLVIARRGGVLLVREQLGETRLKLRRARQHKRKVKWSAGCDRPL